MTMRSIKWPAGMLMVMVLCAGCGPRLPEAAPIIQSAAGATAVAPANIPLASEAGEEIAATARRNLLWAALACAVAGAVGIAAGIWFHDGRFVVAGVLALFGGATCIALAVYFEWLLLALLICLLAALAAGLVLLAWAFRRVILAIDDTKTGTGTVEFGVPAVAENLKARMGRIARAAVNLVRGGAK